MLKRLTGKTKTDRGSTGSADSGFATQTDEPPSSSSSSSSLPNLGTDDKRVTLTKGRHGSTSTISSTTSTVKDLDEPDAIKERIKTFLSEGWCQPVSLKDLAEAGFICTGNSDEVVCIICGVRLSEWNADHVPLKRHREKFPKCRFVKYKRKQKKKKLCFDSPKTLENKDSSDNDDDDDDDNDLFSSEFNRLITFKDWPLSSPVDKYDLAATGFYRVSPSTSVVKCYACEVTVEDWNLGDRPKKKHEHLKPECPHLKGKEIAGNKPLHSSEKQQAVNISIRKEHRAP